MKAKLTTSITIALIFLATFAAQAQQRETISVTDLRKEIQELVIIDRNESTLPDVKDLNRKFIKERQTQLRLLLTQRISALSKYQASVSAIIGREEKMQVQEAIDDLQKELKDLDTEIAGSAAPAATVEKPILAAVRPQTSEITRSTNTDPRSEPATNSSNLANAIRTSPGLPQTQPTKASEAKAADQATEDFRLEVERDTNRIVAEIVKDVRGTTGAERKTAAAGFGPTQNPANYAKILALGLTRSVLPREQFNSEIESARVDKQVGGAASNAGSTSLVSKGSLPSILGFAVENGGLTKTSQGTTITFRGNPVGLLNAFAGKGFISGYEDDSNSPAAKALRKFSFAVSFDTSLGDTPNVLVANKQQLSSYSFHYEFFNHRDPRDPRYARTWKNLVSGNAQAVATDANRVQDLFRRDPNLLAWLEEAQAAIAAAPDDQLDNVVRAQFVNLEKVQLSAGVKNAVTSFQTAFSKYRQERNELLKIVANGPIFTVDYVNNRRPGLIDTSNFNFIYSNGVVKGKASVTVNGAFAFFNSQPGKGMNRLRDYDFSTQLDIPMGDPRGFGQFDLSFAGQLKRLVEDEVANGKIITPKGTIGSFNVKLEVPIKSLGIKFPIALTYSNRTEFDLKKQLRANFGFGFDPDILYNLLKPFGPK